MDTAKVLTAALAVVALSTLHACGEESVPPDAAQASAVDPSECSAESATRGVDLDIPGPGMPTPEEAVAPYLDAYVVTDVEAQQRSATVTTETDGGAIRVFTLTRRDDGWWPDGYIDCTS